MSTSSSDRRLSGTLTSESRSPRSSGPSIAAGNTKGFSGSSSETSAGNSTSDICKFKLLDVEMLFYESVVF